MQYVCDNCKDVISKGDKLASVVVNYGAKESGVTDLCRKCFLGLTTAYPCIEKNLGELRIA